MTALVTCHTWYWSGFARAELFRSWLTAVAFWIANASAEVARWVTRGLPSLRHSLAQRHAMIDFLLTASGVTQVVELAAGLSRRGAFYSEDPSLRYAEVDMPRMMERKRRYLERTDLGRQVLARENFRLLAGDARTVPLAELIDPREPAFFIAEGLVMYFSAAEQLDFYRRVAEVLQRGAGGHFVFDVVPAAELPPSQGAVWLVEWWTKRFTGGRFIVRDGRTRDDVLSDLRRAGFTDVAVLEPHTMDPTCPIPFAGWPTKAVVFSCRVA